MEQTEGQVLSLLSQPLQPFLAAIQVQQVDADGRNAREHLGREQIGDQHAADWTESTGAIQKNSKNGR